MTNDIGSDINNFLKRLRETVTDFPIDQIILDQAADHIEAMAAEINELNKQIADLNNELGCVRRGEWA